MRILIALSLLVFGRLSAQDTVIVRGLPWSVVAVEMDSTWGMCDDPATEGREIWIDPRLSEEHELEIWLHELLHAAFGHCLTLARAFGGLATSCSYVAAFYGFQVKRQ